MFSFEHNKVNDNMARLLQFVLYFHGLFLFFGRRFVISHLYICAFNEVLAHKYLLLKSRVVKIIITEKGTVKI